MSTNYKIWVQGMMLIAVWLLFAPISMKHKPLSTGYTINFNEDLYVEKLLNVKHIYQNSIVRFKGEKNEAVSNISIYKQLSEQLKENYAIDERAKKYHASYYNVSPAFQKIVKELYQNLLAIQADFESNPAAYKEQFLAALHRYEEEVYTHPSIKKEEKIAYRMMYLEQLLLHDEYLEMQNLHYLAVGNKKSSSKKLYNIKNDIAKNILASVWQTSTVLQNENIDAAGSEFANLLYHVKHAHLSE